MNRITGIELIRHLYNNELEMNTKINVYYDDALRTTLIFDGYNLNWEPGTFKVAYLYDGLCDFEIVEDKKIELIPLKEFNISYKLDFIDYKNIEVLKNYLNKDFQTIYDTLDLLILNQKKLKDAINELLKEEK